MTVGSLLKFIISFAIICTIYYNYFYNYYKYKDCDTFLKDKNYTESATCYAEKLKKSAYKERDYIARFNYAYSLQLLEKNDEAKYQYELIIANCKQKEITEPANKNLEILNEKMEWIKKEERKKRRHKNSDYGDYYTDLDETLTWKNPREIKVYINPTDNNKKLLEEAFKKWDYALSDIVNFIYIDDSTKADITAKTETQEVTMQHCSKDEVVGCAAYEYIQYTLKDPLTKNVHTSKKYLNHVNVYVTEIYDSHKFSEDEYIGIALHEIGHALGIASHSPSQGDVMFSTTSSYSQRSGEVSNRDVNTVKRIYGNI